MENKKFKEKVLEIVSLIKRGETLSYKQIAKRAGSPNGYRAVGNIMANNYDSGIPCHRVVKSDGNAGGYNRGGEKIKLKILKKELK